MQSKQSQATKKIETNKDPSLSCLLQEAIFRNMRGREGKKGGREIYDTEAGRKTCQGIFIHSTEQCFICIAMGNDCLCIYKHLWHEQYYMHC